MTRQGLAVEKLKTFIPDYAVKPAIIGFVPPRFVELVEPWVQYPVSPEKSLSKKKNLSSKNYFCCNLLEMRIVVPQNPSEEELEL